MSDSLQPPHAPTPLTANEILALDVLVEHGFDLTRALDTRPDLAFEIQSLHSTMSTLDAYSAEGATRDADPDLVALTLARVDRAARDESDRLQIGAARSTAGSGQWRDIVAIAAVALLVVSVAVPVLSYVKSKQAISSCAANLHQIAGGLEGFVNDHGSLPMSAGFMLPSGQLPNGPAHAFSAADSLNALVTEGYCKAGCLACSSDVESNPRYAVQMASPNHPMQWRSGVRRPLVADRNPLIDALRAGGSITVLSINSPCHGFSGQNVLFTDGTVEFLTTPNFVIAGEIDYLYVPRDLGGLEDDLGSFAEWSGTDSFLAQ